MFRRSCSFSLSLFSAISDPAESRARRMPRPTSAQILVSQSRERRLPSLLGLPLAVAACARSSSSFSPLCCSFLDSLSDCRLNRPVSSNKPWRSTPPKTRRHRLPLQAQLPLQHRPSHHHNHHRRRCRPRPVSRSPVNRATERQKGRKSVTWLVQGRSPDYHLYLPIHSSDLLSHSRPLGPFRSKMMTTCCRMTMMTTSWPSLGTGAGIEGRRKSPCSVRVSPRLSLLK